MQAAVLNICKFDFNRSQFRCLNGDCLLDNTQFLVETMPSHIYRPYQLTTEVKPSLRE
jgi:hypothetical protein